MNYWAILGFSASLGAGIALQLFVPKFAVPVEATLFLGSGAYLLSRSSPWHQARVIRRQKALLDVETKQLQDKVNDLSLILQSKQAEYEALQLAQQADRERHEANLKAQSASYEQQINELEELLNERFNEMQVEEHRHQARLQRLSAKCLGRLQSSSKKLKEELREAAIADEQQLQELENQINEQFEKDKQEYIEACKKERAELTHKYERKIGLLSERIELLEQELGAALEEIQQYEMPQLPEGIEPEIVAARRVMEFLQQRKPPVLTEFRGAWIQEGQIFIKLYPREGGEKQIAKHLNRMQIELKLAEVPEINTVPGAVQLFLKPRSMVSIPSVEAKPNHPPQPPHPEVVESLNAIYEKSFSLRDFVEPSTHCPPCGPITQLERDWIFWLWEYHNPPVRNQKRIIKRVWNATSGDGARFIQARKRLHQILKDADIDFRSKNNEK